ncbi:MAG: lasso RiPP family leader peptide-containing protein [Deltaproteobacteria bacterium]|nr:lasso RiPP family leader peptide-containing protein [Deltaproteobacteria bacterium]
MTEPDAAAAAEHVREVSLRERAASERRAYERPQLAVLGTVRELTRAARGSLADGGLGLQRSS